MAKNGTLILYNYPINGGGFSSKTSANAGTKPDLAKTTFSWSVASQDIVTNTSTINWTLTVENLKKYELSSFTVDELYLNNETNSSRIYYTGTSVDALTNTTAYSGSFTLEHNMDGTLSVPIRIKAYMKAVTTAGASYYSSSAIDNTTTLTLDTIPRHAVLLSAPNFTDEDSPTITFAIPNGVTNVRAYIAFNTSTIDIGSYAVSGSSYTFKFTEAEKKKLWSILEQGLDTRQVYFYVMSEFQGTLYHSDPLIRTLTIINYKPTIAPEVVADSNDVVNADLINRLTGDEYKFVRYVSNAYWKTGAKAYKGATIESQYAKNGGLNPIHAASGVIEGITSNVFKFTAVDNYGRSVSTDYTIPDTHWIPYIKLTCSAEVTEMTGEGKVNVTLKGKYFDGHFGKKSNTLRMNYDISKDGDEFEHVDKGYIYPSVDDEGNYTYTFPIENLEYLSVYELTVRVSDEISVEPTETHTVIASTPIFDWGRTDFNFNVPVNINGDLTLTGNITAGGNTVPTIVAQGTAGIWTYRTWSDGTAECWGKKDFTVNITSAWGSMYTSGAISGSNVSFPYGLFAETPIVNASLLVRSAGGILMAPGGAGSNIANMDQTGVYEIARGTSLSNAAYTINYQVIGRWK